MGDLISREALYKYNNISLCVESLPIKERYDMYNCWFYNEHRRIEDGWRDE